MTKPSPSSLEVLKAANPLARLDNARTARHSALSGVLAGVILSVVTGMGALSVHLERAAFLAEFERSLGNHPRREALEGQGELFLNLTLAFGIGLTLLFVALSFVQSRRLGWGVPIVFTLFALFPLPGRMGDLLQGQASSFGLVSLALYVVVALVSIAAFRGGLYLHRHDAVLQPPSPPAHD